MDTSDGFMHPNITEDFPSEYHESSFRKSVSFNLVYTCSNLEFVGKRGDIFSKHMIMAHKYTNMNDQ